MAGYMTACRWHPAFLKSGVISEAKSECKGPLTFVATHPHGYGPYAYCEEARTDFIASHPEWVITDLPVPIEVVPPPLRDLIFEGKE